MFSNTKTQKPLFFKPLFLVALCYAASPASADIVLDGSLGQSGALNGPDFIISSNAGQQSGGNLFHSFSQFNINNGESAHFSGNASINNIFSRVTGGSPSNINGALSADANLYFMNPAGIVFGGNASVNIDGSLHLTTADYLRFADGESFFSGLGNSSTLSVAEVSAFGFLDNTIGNIHFQGNQPLESSLIEIASDESLVVVGGDISFSNYDIFTGNLSIGAIGSAGEVVFEEGDFIIPSNVQLGDLSIRESSGFRVISPNLVPHAILYADELIQSQSSISVGSRVAAESSSTAELKIKVNRYTLDGGGLRAAAEIENPAVTNLLIDATESVELNNTSIELTIDLVDNNLITNFDKHLVIRTGILNINDSSIESLANVNGANIVFDTNEIHLSDNSLVLAGLLAAIGVQTNDNNTGQMLINTDILRINNSAIGRSTTPNIVSADIAVFAEQIDISNGGGLFTNTRTFIDGGSINIEAQQLMINAAGAANFTGINAQAENVGTAGRGGDINIAAQSIILDNGAEISASTTGIGNAGQINVQATNLTIANSSELKASTSGNTGDQGAAGDIIITTQITEIRNEGLLSTSADTIADAGRIEIRSGELLINSGGSINAVNQESSVAGEINIAADHISINGQGFNGFTGITGETLNQSGNTNDIGVSNNIILEADSIDIVAGGQISNTNFGRFSGGDIQITANNHLRIDGQNAAQATGLFAESRGIAPSSSGGNINIQAAELSILNTGIISADSSGPGTAGNIAIAADKVSLNHIATVRSSSNSTTNGGDAGNILIEATDRIELNNQSRISTQAANAGGGNIELNAVNLLRLNDSEIITSVFGGDANGGNIGIDPLFVILENNSRIAARASEGRGGNISVITEVFIKSLDSQISASSELGIDGTIEINTLDINIDDEIAALPGDFADASQWVNIPCSQRAGDNVSGFALKGRDGAHRSADQLQMVRASNVDQDTAIAHKLSGLRTNRNKSGKLTAKQLSFNCIEQ